MISYVPYVGRRAPKTYTAVEDTAGKGQWMLNHRRVSPSSPLPLNVKVIVSPATVLSR
jgi:hypothetical protein